MKIQLTKKEKRMTDIYLYSDNCLLKEKGAKFLYKSTSKNIVRFLISKIINEKVGIAVRASYGLSIMDKSVVVKNVRETLLDIKDISYSSAFYLLKSCENWDKDFEKLIIEAVNSKSENIVHAALSFLVYGKFSKEFIIKHDISKIISDNLKNRNYLLPSIIKKVGTEQFKDEIKEILEKENLDKHEKSSFLEFGSECKLDIAKEGLLRILKSKDENLINRVNSAINLSVFYNMDTSDKILSLINSASLRYSITDYWLEKVEEIISNHTGLEILKKLLKSNDYKKICFVLSVIGSLKIKKVEGLIIGFIKNKNPFIRATALKTLSCFGSKKYFNEIKNCLNDSIYYVRRNAITALNKIDFKGKNEILLKMLKDKSAIVRNESLKALGESKDLEMRERILKMFYSEEYLGRKTALSYTLRNKLYEARKYIIKCLKNNEYMETEKIEMLNVFKTIGRLEDIPVLKKLLYDNSPQVRIAALMAINEIRIRGKNNFITLNFKMR